MTPTEFHHWRYRVIALIRDVAELTDLVAMASAYKSPVTMEDRMRHQKDLDMAKYLLAEAEHHVATASVS